MARNARVGTIGVSTTSLWSHIPGEKKPVAQGGCGETAWILLDQPGTVVPARNRERPTNTDGTTSEPSTTEVPSFDGEYPGPLPVVSPPRVSPPREHRRSIESKFSEDFPKRRSSTPLQWIKKRVASRSEVRNIAAIPSFQGAKSTEPGREESSESMTGRFRRRMSNSVIFLNTPKRSSQEPKDRPSTQDLPFLNQVDKALLAGASPAQKIRRLSSAVVDPVRRISTARVAKDLPPRSQSVPPQLTLKNTAWNLEYLPSEARGVKTPNEYPVYGPSTVGGTVLPISRERKYFNLADMVQSRPPLEPAGSGPGQLSPTNPDSVTAANTLGYSYSESDFTAIAPFMEQDELCRKERKPSLSSAILFTGRKLRRASTFAKNAFTGKLAEVPETAKPGETSEAPGRTFLEDSESVPGQVRSGRGVVKWIKRGSTIGDQDDQIPRRGQHSRDLVIIKPTEVVIEEAKRKKRDTGVIGLDPVDSQSSSTDDSYTYTSALRDIAGLSKRPRGPAELAAKRSGRIIDDDIIGEFVTPPPPGFPSGIRPPGSLAGKIETNGEKESHPFISQDNILTVYDQGVRRREDVLVVQISSSKAVHVAMAQLNSPVTDSVSTATSSGPLTPLGGGW